MMVSFVLSFFPRDVLDEILNLIESVSEDFPSYSNIQSATYIPIQEVLHLTDGRMDGHIERQYTNWCRQTETYTKLYNYIRTDGRIDDQTE